ncbi:Stp1/IreP family PP2C-type Ser/Thr phosphatase [Collinsella sp. zg1085]|nr:Stp1/IreP family PP2C-type Ser/Thr phosphatase [Collinsella sp. zg1085]
MVDEHENLELSFNSLSGESGLAPTDEWAAEHLSAVALPEDTAHPVCADDETPAGVQIAEDAYSSESSEEAEGNQVTDALVSTEELDNEALSDAALSDEAPLQAEHSNIPSFLQEDYSAAAHASTLPADAASSALVENNPASSVSDPTDASDLPLSESTTSSSRSVSPADTAEIDVEAVEAQLKNPGSTQSFEPITDDQLIDADSTYDAGTTTSLMWGARSDVGCIRSHNEDSYLVQSPLFCVCDGMGGHAAGEVASSIAVQTIAKTAPHTADAAMLGAAVEAANAAVIEAARNGRGKPGMGCTATTAFFEHDLVAIAHVGDSRAYLLHDESLIRITNDHSYVEELVAAGEITADEARVHPNRSVITRALGSDPAMYADHFQISIEPGDRLILCSDGLSSMISDGEIERIATQSATAQICTDNLVDAALAAGGADNVTVVVVDLVDDGRAEEASKQRRKRIIAGVAALAILLLLAALITFFSLSSSVYLGVKNGRVAIYHGVPNDFLGLSLHQLEDVSTVEIEDLPEDTQHRLIEGIPQESVESAIETVSKYRKQIFEDQTRAGEQAAMVKNSEAASSNQTPSNGSGNANDAASQPAEPAQAPTNTPAPESSGEAS